jgi:hypothetical protein
MEVLYKHFPVADLYLDMVHSSKDDKIVNDNLDNGYGHISMFSNNFCLALNFSILLDMHKSIFSQ